MSRSCQSATFSIAGAANERNHASKAGEVLGQALYGKAIVPYQLAGVEDTIEELEKSLGLPEGQLVHTFESYNRAAERGEDPVFHKASKYVTPLSNPPYAALDLSVDKSVWATFTLGGLDTKASGEVLGADGQVIPGLYAAGRASAGLTRSGRSMRAACRSAAGASSDGSRGNRRQRRRSSATQSSAHEEPSAHEESSAQ